MHISRSWGRLYFANSSTNNQGLEYTIVDTYGGPPNPTQTSGAPSVNQNNVSLVFTSQHTSLTT
jgi:hypothetical protein